MKIEININREKNNVSTGSLCTTDWLNTIKQNKTIVKGVEKNIISSTKFLKKLYDLGYIEKLSKNKGYISTEKYLKKGYFEDCPYDIKDVEGNKKRTKHTLYITRKGQRRLLNLVLKLIDEN